MAEAKHQIHIHDDWVSVKLPDVETVHAFHGQLLENEAWTEVIGGLKSIAVQFDPALLSPEEAAELLHELLSSVPGKPQDTATAREIPICYAPDFAPDIEMVADRLGMPASEISEWHSAFDFTVTMLGFMPGFAYLQCVDGVPEIGRLPQPRKLVPAGSIGLIGSQSCIYSFDSPGGWPIVGRTPITLFDPDKNPAALLVPGQKVQFVPVTKAEYEAML